MVAQTARNDERGQKPAGYDAPYLPEGACFASNSPEQMMQAGCGYENRRGRGLTG
ncbi:hypothetical protein GbCGDNIH2_5115 [Granulibacter bethesdensis]|uniref:Uncharacterized protein n=1 Tax=Granulibacter bethesdensis TaxID=364410 RepID=A0AAN0RG23_9PROT|nr:hypothetical protein GbCGDNIH3_5115 [Granulibacter bethesdensis]AHJ66949.1 hypothetical protein GbCGDNIH4_5115 [Granulibacter bethesdensis CGDNIH4]AHJ69617.1 hypothetical protein GbCGDNIH2_5115 [Granulibacter bethesdensis]APH60767.1 hypothetical protein GbCGDNIH7_5115 [Granulibacter bethesdensis]